MKPIARGELSSVVGGQSVAEACKVGWEAGSWIGASTGALAGLGAGLTAGGPPIPLTMFLGGTAGYTLGGAVGCASLAAAQGISNLITE